MKQRRYISTLLLLIFMTALGIQTLESFMCHCEHISVNHVCSEKCHTVEHVDHNCLTDYLSSAKCIFHKNDNSLLVIPETRVQKSTSNVTVLHPYLISDQQLIASSPQYKINREYRGDEIPKYICKRDIRSLRAPPVLV